MGAPRDPLQPDVRSFDEILSAVSHDLRSPLSALSVAIDALHDPDLDDQVRERYLAAMRRSIQRAERFLSHLVDAGRIAAGTFHVDVAPVAVAAVVEAAAREHQDAAREAGNWFAVEIADGVDHVVADQTRLIQALGCVINNAIKYARGTGAITLRAEKISGRGRNGGGGAVRISVIDHGPGIPAAEMSRLFDKYWRGSGLRRNSAGLGLAISKGIAEAHRGSLHVASQIGHGATFWMDLPGASNLAR